MNVKLFFDDVRWFFSIIQHDFVSSNTYIQLAIYLYIWWWSGFHERFCYAILQIIRKQNPSAQRISLEITDNEKCTIEELKEFNDDRLNQNTNHIKLKFHPKSDLLLTFAVYPCCICCCLPYIASAKSRKVSH